MTVMDTKTGALSNSAPESSRSADPMEATGNPVPNTRSQSDRILDQMFGDTPLAKSDDSIAEMQRDSSAPLTSAVISRLLDPKETDQIAEAVLPHLCRSGWARFVLRQALEFANAEQNHPAYALLLEAEDWGKWSKAGQTAANSATERLTEQEIGYIYGRNGGVYRRLPDGSEETIEEAPGE